MKYLLSFLLLSSLVSAREIRCGGDGPNPLALLPAAAPAVVVPTNGQPREFRVWESRKQVVYRNDQNLVRVRALDGSDDKIVTKSSVPLATWNDAAERFIVGNLGSWVFDALAGRAWPRSNGSFQPLFSNFGEDAITGVVTTPSGWAIQRWTANGRQQVCAGMVLPSSLQLSQGHRYPYLHFYDVRDQIDGRILYTHRVDVSRCSISSWQFLRPIEGEVQAVYAFEPMEAVAAKIDHPTMNLLWHSPESSCRYFDVGNSVPLQPSAELPVLVTQTSGGGVKVIHLTQEKQITVLKDDPSIVRLQQGDAQLIADGRELFLRSSTRPALLRLPLQ